MDADGNVTVANPLNHRIQVFNAFSQTSVLDDGESDSFTLEPGMYQISEQVPEDWELTNVNCDGGSPVYSGNSVHHVTLAAADDVTCTFINAEQIATLIVEKQTDPDGASGSFTFTSDVGDLNGDLSDDGTLTAQVEPGTYTVTESDPASAFVLTDITCDDSDSTGDTGTRTATFVAAAAETITCVFTNTQQPGSIEVVKTVVGAPPEDEWAFSGDLGNFTLPATGGSTTFADVAAGSYLISETAVPGYTQSVSCDSGESGTGSVTVNLAPGEEVVCTFTNSAQQATLIIEKVTRPESATAFSFTSDIPGGATFELTDDGTDTDNTISFTVDAGTYQISEEATAGWTLTSQDCSNGDTAAAVTLTPGESVTCTFANAQQPGAIQVIKEIVGDATGSFEICLSGGPGDLVADCRTFNGGGAQQTWSGLTPGSGYLISETDAGPEWAEPAPQNVTVLAGQTVDVTVTNTYTPAPPQSTMLFFSAATAGTTAGGLAFGAEDILRRENDTWTIFFDGSAAGLQPKNNVSAIHIPDPDSDDVYLSFAQNKLPKFPGLGLVQGQDIVHHNGTGFNWYFDGSDVGLTTTGERIDSLHILDGSLSPIGTDCAAYLLISTVGTGKVAAAGGGTLKVQGEDILGFCATNLGTNTTGFWHMVLDGSAEGMPKNSTDSISASDDGTTLYLTTKKAFNVDDATGGHSMVYKFNRTTGQFSGPFFSAPANELPQQVDGLHVEGDLP